MFNKSTCKTRSLLGSMCIIITNFASIGRTIADIKRFICFKMATVRHLGFYKFEVLYADTARRLNVLYRTKFPADRSNCFGDMAIFRFSRWWPSVILDLLYACLDHPRGVFAGICQCAKFVWIRCSSFDNLKVLTVCASGLKCVFTPQKSGFSGYFTPCGKQYQRDPKTAVFAQKRFT